jgi:hypothetical protein
VEYSFADGGSYEASHPAPQVAAGAGAYIVQFVDTLSQIVVCLGTSIDHLAKHNDVADPDLLHSGQMLYSGLPEEGHVGGGSRMVDDLGGRG